MIAQLARVDAVLASKRSMIQRQASFIDAWAVAIRQFVLLRRFDAVRVQSELVNVEQTSGKSVLQYVDGVDSLWQELEGTSLTVTGTCAVDRMRRGLSPDQGTHFYCLHPLLPILLKKCVR
jgi:hypothetical protein